MALAERDYTVHAVTTSLCSICLARVDAKVLLRAGSVYLQKRCPGHGLHEELLEEDAAYWLRRGEYDKPGTLTPPDTATDRGCPYDCGLCPDHEQHTCIGLVEITTACDLGCPVCFASAGTGKPLPLETIRAMLEQYVRAEGGHADVLQVSGGEPTTHPQVLEVLAMAREMGIRYVMLNTNGLRIARDPDFARALGAVKGGFEVYLQFDGLTPSVHQSLRGRDLVDVKSAALANLADAGVPATLVCTVQRGVNDDQLGRIVEFAMRAPAVRGISFQPLAYFGRLDGADPGGRITLTGVLRRIEEQMAGMLKVSDFVPLPCNVERVAFTIMLRQGGGFVPITRKADVRKYLGALPNTLAFYAQDVIRNAAGSVLCGSGGCDCMRFVKDLLPLASIGLRGLASRDKPQFTTDNVFRISVTSFLDRYNFEMKAMKKECVHVLLPDGRRVPFSSYNVLHRDGEPREVVPCPAST